MANGAAQRSFDTSKQLRLSDEVSLRDESFGALAYHHVNRRLIFLKSRGLVELVRRLHEFSSADEAMSALVSSDERPRYERALQSLYRSELLNG